MKSQSRWWEGGVGGRFHCSCNPVAFDNSCIIAPHVPLHAAWGSRLTCQVKLFAFMLGL